MVRIIWRNALITTNTLLIHCTKTICLTYSLNGQFTNANGTKERIYPHSFSVYGEGERRSRILASFKSHILLVWCVNVLTVFVVMFGWPWGWMLVSKWFFHIPQESNRNNSNFLNLRFQTKKTFVLVIFSNSKICEGLNYRYFQLVLWNFSNSNFILVNIWLTALQLPPQSHWVNKYQNIQISIHIFICKWNERILYSYSYYPLQLLKT